MDCPVSRTHDPGPYASRHGEVMDLTEKRFVYAQAHIPAYWLIDPETMTLTILELVDHQYVERAVLERDAQLDVTLPFSMTVSAAEVFS